MPVANRAGMLTARHSATIKCAKSRHTPTCSISVSTAEVLELDVFEVKVTLAQAVLLTAARNFARELRLVPRAAGDNRRLGPTLVTASELGR